MEVPIQSGVACPLEASPGLGPKHAELPPSSAGRWPAPVTARYPVRPCVYRVRDGAPRVLATIDRSAVGGGASEQWPVRGQPVPFRSRGLQQLQVHAAYLSAAVRSNRAAGRRCRRLEWERALDKNGPSTDGTGPPMLTVYRKETCTRTTQTLSGVNVELCKKCSPAKKKKSGEGCEAMQFKLVNALK